MKKFLLAIMLMAGIGLSASARDRYTHDVNVLPAAARTVLKNNFKGDVSVIKVDKDFGRVSEYEVILTDGSEVTFDRSGNWKDIESSMKSSVPDKMVPQAIRDWVKQNQKGARIVGIEKKRNGYEIELSNGIDAEFNSAGRFLRYD
ncbi:MAG: PepSY-like domain-containing protein [Prevotella sp.]|nr:PepSY-like domain-containing protein [Prevotella sp.]MCM1074592.1 PepSY-like domain-containing protein [Ruminococcus sp.]